MRRRRKDLETLIACLRGEPPGKADWAAVFEIANRTLLTPALFDALTRSSQFNGIPDEARAYLEFIHGRNAERNARLRAQLIEAVGQLNSAGIEPTLLKGAVRLFCDPDERLGSRMTKDLDLSVEDHEGAAANACLFAIGYRDAVETRGMGRPQDVGILELRQQPRAASAAYLPREHEKPSRVLERAGVRARIPSAESRALHWIVHDLIKEGDYWRGCIDIRHLYDLFELTRTERDLDWRHLWSIMPDRLGRNVIETQLLTLHSFFGVDMPPGMESGGIAHLQHWRRAFAAMHPVAGAPLRLAGDIAWGMRRMGTFDKLARRGFVDFARKVCWTLTGGMREYTKL